MTYQEALVFLDNLQLHKIKLGLDAMRSFLSRIDQPEKKLKCIHVAGTNGKGSVSATMLTILQRAGYSVGLYTSPHLSSVRERFRINDTYISEGDFARLATHIRDILGEDTITYFEFTTALALLWFAESELDLVILETGLGGRLDATNVVTPLISIITSISMDHETYLGNTLIEVAGEKAGIIKKNVPLIAAGGEPEVTQVLKEVTARQNADMFLLGREFSYDGQSNENWSWQANHERLGTSLTNLKCAMRGAYQRENASLAIAALHLLEAEGLKVSETAIADGLATVSWPGRLEYLVLQRDTRQRLAPESIPDGKVVRYLLDGAHNPEGLNNLAMTLSSEYDYQKLIVIWGAMIDKDIAAGLGSMLPLADTLILTRPEGERSAEPEELLACLPNSDQKNVVLVRDVAEALNRAEQLADAEDMIVIAGSLYLVGAVRTLLVGELVDE